MPSDHLRILSTNLFSSRADPADLCAKVRALDVDVVCAQELGFETAERLRDVLPHGTLLPDSINRGLGIASRWEAEVTELSLPKRNGLVARLAPGSGAPIQSPIEIINWHVMGPHTWPYFPNRNTRKGQLERLLNHTSSAEPIPRAVLGDYNASPAWPFYKSMRRHFDDAAEHGGLTKPTWPRMPAIGVRGWFRIDHCMTQGLVCTNAEVVDILGSDHFGLLVDLRLA